MILKKKQMKESAEFLLNIYNYIFKIVFIKKPTKVPQIYSCLLGLYNQELFFFMRRNF